MSGKPVPTWHKKSFVTGFSLLVLVSIYTAWDLFDKQGVGFSNLGVYLLSLAIIFGLSALTFVLAGWSILRHATSVSSIRIQASEAHNQSMERALRKLRRILISVGIAGAVTVLYQLYVVSELDGQRTESFSERRLEARDSYSFKYTVSVVCVYCLCSLSLSLSLSLSVCVCVCVSVCVFSCYLSPFPPRTLQKLTSFLESSTLTSHLGLLLASNDLHHPLYVLYILATSLD